MHVDVKPWWNTLEAWATESMGLALGTALRMGVCSLLLVTSHRLVLGAPHKPGL